MTLFPEGLEPVDDLAPMTWVRDALRDWPEGRPFIVSDLVPAVFEAYARVLHPPRRPTDLQISTGTWAARATEVGVSLGPETRWEDLERAGSDSWSLWPGELMGPEVGALAAVLSDDSSETVDCWFGLWSGFAEEGRGSAYHMAGGPLARRLATWRVRASERRRDRRDRRKRRRPDISLLGDGRSYFLFRGPVAAAESMWSSTGHCPTIWWSDDRAWFVHTEVDATSTYVGGSARMIGRLVGEQVLESFDVDPGDAAL